MDKGARPKNLKPSWRSRWVLSATVFSIVVIGPLLFDILTTQGKIYPGVSIGPVKIGGLSSEKAKTTLKNYFNNFLKGHVTFVLEQIQAPILLDDLISIDADQTIKNAVLIGHSGSTVQMIQQRLRTRFLGNKIKPVLTIKQEAFASILVKIFQDTESLPKDAKFAFDFATADQPNITIATAQSGMLIDLETAKNTLIAQTSLLVNKPINLTHTFVTASITSADLTPLIPQLQELFSKTPVEIKSKNKNWTIPNATLASWINVNKAATGVTSALDQAQIIQWLKNIATEIEKKPKDAIFKLAENGEKTTAFQIGEDGISLPLEENATAIAETILDKRTFELVLRSIPPQTQSTEEAGMFGIKELVGVGSTNFKGSPTNRIKNITRGAVILNGTLIKPGEEFSLIKRLTPFTLENGYFPEMVIKAAEKKTVPEIGGGLCQIGTTAFRVALNSGLPVTERANHSYRVSYYEPPVGMDATIYDPAPDLKFINDTNQWLLLTTEIKGTYLTFKLWGTKDGREIKMTEPEVFNFKKPPEKKIVATTDLPPGKTKCTERAHTGVDAKFTYTVTYPNNEIKETEFFSRYQPWQEICLLGVESLPEPEKTVEPETSVN